MEINKLITIILIIGIFLSCNKNNDEKRYFNKKLTLTIYQEQNILKVKEPLICIDSTTIQVGIKVGISKKVIIKLTIEYGKDTLVMAKPLDYLLSNPPNSNSFFSTLNKNTELYGKIQDTIFWTYILHNANNKNDFTALQRYVKQKNIFCN